MDVLRNPDALLHNRKVAAAVLLQRYWRGKRARLELRIRVANMVLGATETYAQARC